jgi:hypothetical protein
MNKKFRWVIGALVIVLLAVGVYGTKTAYADDGDPPRPPLGGHGPHDGRGLDGVALEAVADVLNMEPDEVTAALEDGRTLPELAEEVGVDMQEVHDALQAVREESMREHIAQAVEDGNITQEHADWLLEGLDKGFLDGPVFGFGRGFGGHPQKGTPPAQAE